VNTWLLTVCLDVGDDVSTGLLTRHDHRGRMPRIAHVRNSACTLPLSERDYLNFNAFRTLQDSHLVGR
jgi:hypothetical protein